MKDIQILYSYPLRIGVSGIGITAWNQVNELVKKNIRVHLVAASIEKQFNGLAYARETFKLLNIKLPLRPLGAILSARIHDITTAKILQSGKLKIDAVHCWPLGSQYTIQAAKKLGIKTFLERPNTHTGYAYEVVRQEYRRIGLKQDKHHTHTYNKKHLEIESREYDLADYILCPSDFVARTFLLYGFEEKKLAYHHYGYDPERYYSLKKQNHANEKLTIIFIGRCEPRKGLHHALDAWLASDASRDGKFYICGDFEDGYREFLGDRLLHGSIEITGFINNVTPLLQKCDALILPSIEEGSALVTYEAKACGTTLLISDSTGAHAEHMHNCLIHKQGDVEALTSHINLLYKDKKLLNKLKKNSLASAAELTWGKSADALIKIYSKGIQKSQAANG